MPTPIDNAIQRFSKPLILTFSVLVLVATAPALLSGLVPSSSKRSSKTIPPEQLVKDEEFPGEPKDWSQTQLTAWLANVSSL